MNCTRFSLTLLALIPFILHADLVGFPDDLISDNGQTKLEMGINYSNGTSYNCSNLFSCTRSSTDTMTWTPGIRYGISSHTELYTHGSWYNSRSRDTSLLTSTETTSAHDRLSDLWVGINHRIWDDATTPGLLLFLEGAAMENATLGSNVNPVYGKTWQIGGTMYRSTDPIILSATASYRYALSKDYGGSLSSGASSTLLFNPAISFAANNEVSLTSGFQWQRQGSQTIHAAQDTITSRPITRTDLILGVGYMWNNNLTFHVSTSTDMTGDGGSSISMMGIYSLGDRKRKNEDSIISDELRIKPTIAPKEAEAKDPLSSSYVPSVTPVIPARTESKPQQEASLEMGQITIPAIVDKKKVFLSCVQVAYGWNETQLECHEIDHTISITPLGSFQDEIIEGKQWIRAQNPKHYTIEISLQNRTQESLLLDHLKKTRFSYSHPSHVHLLPNHMAAVALGSFETRQEALSFLQTLPFVTNKSNSLLRTFGGLSH
jgi:hypothetical protein